MVNRGSGDGSPGEAVFGKCCVYQQPVLHILKIRAVVGEVIQSDSTQ